MSVLQDKFERLWTGLDSVTQQGHHPFHPLDLTEELADGIAFYKGMANLTVVRTDEGCVLVDTGAYHPTALRRQFDSIRSFTKQRVHSAIYTHGHVDHAYGLPPFLAEARDKGWDLPRVLGHEAVAPRMQRYLDTAGYNTIINSRQFGFPTGWPQDPVLPDVTYRQDMTIHVGGRTIELHHAKGETDDHTWTFLPDARVLCTGDLFIWATPNAGNPQKVQRYVIEWARALRAMAERKPLLLLPGHGLPIFGEEPVQQALLRTAEFLESLHSQVLSLLNQGATIYDIVASLKVPTQLTDLPYLQPIYDEPEFVARNLHRLYGGWYSGVPCELKPAQPARQAHEIVGLAGGSDKLLARARALLDADDLQLACHLVDWAVAAAPDDEAAHRLRAEVYSKRQQAERSLMAKGIYGAAARESQEKSSDDPH